MVQIYVRLLLEGLKEIEQVPLKIREEVRIAWEAAKLALEA